MEILTWEKAYEWIDNANIKKDIHEEPQWSFDCGFKLDFDGSLISVTSRFYPPNYNSSGKWEGKMTIKCLDKVIIEKEFVNDKLDNLRKDVEDFITHYSNVIKENLKLKKQNTEMLDFINRISGEMLRNDFVLDEKWYDKAIELIKEATEL